MKKIIILIMLLGLASISYGSQFGRTDSTGAVDDWAGCCPSCGYCIMGGRFAATGDGVIDSLSFLLRASAGGASDSLGFALYKASDSSLVDSTAHFLITGTSPTWHHFPVLLGGSVVSGTNYYISMKAVQDTIYFPTEEASGYSDWIYNDVCAVAWPSKFTPTSLDANWSLIAYITYGVGGAPPDTAELSLAMSGLDTTYNSVRVRCDITTDNEGDCDSMRFYCSNSTSIKVTLPADPQDTAFSSLDAETEYDFWAIGYDNDSSLTAYSDTISIETDAEPPCQPPPAMSAGDADSVHSDYSAELDTIFYDVHAPDSDFVGYVKVCWATSGYPDSAVADSAHFNFVQDATITDTIPAWNGTETYILSFSAWAVNTGNSCWSTRHTWNQSFTGEASTGIFLKLGK